MIDVYVFLADGFEEIEAITTIDLLRRAGLATVMVSVSDHLEVFGAHNISLIADRCLEDVDVSSARAYVLPGGMPGVTNLNAVDLLRQTIKKAYDEQKLIGAICAAPMILGELGILKEKEAICYPSFEASLQGAKLSDKPVVCSGCVITAKAAGWTIDFALEIIRSLEGEEKASQIKAEITPC